MKMNFSPIDDAYTIFPEIKFLIEEGAKHFIGGCLIEDLNGYNQIELEYVFQRQLMFIEDLDLEKLEQKFKNDEISIKRFVSKKRQEVIAKFPYLESKSLKKEFRTQICSFLLSCARVAYNAGRSNSKEELIKNLNKSLIKKDESYKIKFLDKNEKLFLKEMKKNLMNDLKLTPEDFYLTFGTDSLVRMVDEI